MMKRKPYTLLLALFALLLAGCVADDDDAEGTYNDSTALSALYDGEWKVDGSDAGQGELAVYTSGFAFSTLPYGAVLRAALPGRTVECSGGDGYMVPYDNIGYSQQAVYMRLGASQWAVPAVIDGTPRTALLVLDDQLGTGGNGASATYSRVSGVYSMTFPLREVSLLDAGGQTVETVPAHLQATFTTIKRKN